VKVAHLVLCKKVIFIVAVKLTVVDVVDEDRVGLADEPFLGETPSQQQNNGVNHL
jgi:hypothetical protein